MKRGKPLKRTPLQRQKRLASHKGLARGEVKLRRTSLKHARWNRHDWEQYTKRMASAHHAWKLKVARGRCVMCQARGVTVDAHSIHDAHHIVPARYIRRYVRSLRLDAPEAAKLLARLLYDPRNGLCLCRRDHDKHETGYTRVPRELIPSKAFQFARELKLDYVIDRFYPE